MSLKVKTLCVIWRFVVDRVWTLYNLFQCCALQKSLSFSSWILTQKSNRQVLSGNDLQSWYLQSRTGRSCCIWMYSQSLISTPSQLQTGQQAVVSGFIGLKMWSLLKAFHMNRMNWPATVEFLCAPSETQKPKYGLGNKPLCNQFIMYATGYCNVSFLFITVVVSAAVFKKNTYFCHKALQITERIIMGSKP